MIPKFVIAFIYVFVLVSTDDQEVEKNAVKNFASQNISTVLGSGYTTNVKSELGNEKVKIQLYYESLCGSCNIFVRKPFRNTVIQLRSYLDVQIYPFGNAEIQQDGSIVCQHGPAECYGNKLHACAIDYLDDIILSVIYNGCMMERWHGYFGSNDAAADECGNLWGIESEPIKQCAKGPKGEELLKFYGEESKKVNYEEGVPFVLINGVHGDTDNFRSDVCNSFKTPPEQCKIQTLPSTFFFDNLFRFWNTTYA